MMLLNFLPQYLQVYSLFNEPSYRACFPLHGPAGWRLHGRESKLRSLENSLPQYLQIAMGYSFLVVEGEMEEMVHLVPEHLILDIGNQAFPVGLTIGIAMAALPCAIVLLESGDDGLNHFLNFLRVATVFPVLGRPFCVSVPFFKNSHKDKAFSGMNHGRMLD